MTGKKILVVEDEQDILDLIVFNLERDGFQVISAQTGEDALTAAREHRPDLVLLDLMLPGINGLDVCRHLRNDENGRNLPIIMLTARDEEVDIVTGLEVGADDYVTKPFSPKVLIARVRAMLRRREKSADQPEAPLNLGDLSIDQVRHRVDACGKRVDLTNTEFELLVILSRRPGWVFSRSQLIDLLHGGQHVITERAIDVQVANLRKKLGDCGQYVQTVRGVGYRMQEPG
jgi:two-component system phosphate regulon response regulator PhoB